MKFHMVAKMYNFGLWGIKNNTHTHIFSVSFYEENEKYAVIYSASEKTRQMDRRE